jgi:hypothetical protein
VPRIFDVLRNAGFRTSSVGRSSRGPLGSPGEVEDRLGTRLAPDVDQRDDYDAELEREIRLLGELTYQYPKMPVRDRSAVLGNLMEADSGEDLGRQVYLAVNDYARSTYTIYDEVLKDTGNEQLANDEVRCDLRAVVIEWGEYPLY